MALETFARQSLAQFAIIYAEIFDGKPIAPDQLETLMWGRMCAKEAGITKTGFKIPFENIKRAKVILPYMPNDITYTGCCAIKKNGGLYTPCCGKVVEDSFFCKTCSVDKEGEVKELEFGSMEDRESNIEDERFAPITFGEWMKGHKTTLTEVYSKLAAAGIALEVPSEQLVCRSLPKTRRGRPSKSDEEVSDEDSAPKKKPTKAKSPKASPAASEDEAPKKKSKAKAKSDDEAPKKKAPKVKEPEPESDSESEPEPEPVKAKPSPKPSPKTSPKPSPKVSPKSSPKSSPAASEDESPKAKKAPKAEKPAKAEKAPKEAKAEKPAKAEKAPKEAKAEKPAKAEKAPKEAKAENPAKAEKAEKPKKDAKADKAKKAKEPEPEPELDVDALAAAFEKEESEDEGELETCEVDGKDYNLRNSKYICDMEDGTILGSIDDEGDVVWNSDKR